jgi:hypothetical protein
MEERNETGVAALAGTTLFLLSLSILVIAEFRGMTGMAVKPDNLIVEISKFAETNLSMLLYISASVIILLAVIYLSSHFDKTLLYSRLREHTKKNRHERIISKEREMIEIREQKKAEERRRKEKELELKNKRLKDFVESALDKGIELKDVKRALELEGWPRKFADKYCNKFFKIYGERAALFKKMAEAESKKKEMFYEAQIEDLTKELNRL